MNLKLENNSDDIYIDEPNIVLAMSIGEENFLNAIYKIADKYHVMTESEVQTIIKIANEKSSRTEI